MSASAASARSRSRTTSPTSIPARPAARSRPAREASGATRTSCPFAERPRDPLEPGLTPLVRADRLAERLGLGELWIKNDAANPTHSFKDRVVAVALAKARELGFETVACASTGNLANAVAAHAAASRPRLLRVRARRPRGAEAARHRGLRDAPGRRPRHLRRRQPPLHPALRDAAVGVRQRQPAARTTPRAPRRSPTRPSSSSAGRYPTRSSARSPPARCSRRSPRGSPSGWSSAWSRASCRPSTAPRRRAAAPSPPRSPRAGMSASRSARRRSPRASRSATPPTASTRSTWRGEREARSTRSPTTRSATASACWPRRPASSPRRPAA